MLLLHSGFLVFFGGGSVHFQGLGAANKTDSFFLCKLILCKPIHIPRVVKASKPCLRMGVPFFWTPRPPKSSSKPTKLCNCLALICMSRQELESWAFTTGPANLKSLSEDVKRLKRAEVFFFKTWCIDKLEIDAVELFLADLDGPMQSASQCCVCVSVCVCVCVSLCLCVSVCLCLSLSLSLSLSASVSVSPRACVAVCAYPA